MEVNPPRNELSPIMATLLEQDIIFVPDVEGHVSDREIEKG